MKCKICQAATPDRNRFLIHQIFLHFEREMMNYYQLVEDHKTENICRICNQNCGIDINWFLIHSVLFHDSAIVMQYYNQAVLAKYQQCPQETIEGGKFSLGIFPTNLHNLLN